MAANLMVNQSALDLIRKFEGEKLTVYRDSAGLPTVGVGHLVRPEDNLHVGDTITKQQSDNFLQRDLKSAEDDVDRITQRFGFTLNDNQRGALTSFTFNLGAGNLRKLLAHGFNHIPSRMLLFDHASGKVLAGLTRRREAERKLFTSEHTK